MPTQNVNVTDRNAEFVRSQVQNGAFKNVSEVHRAALIEMERRLEERDAALAWLKREAQVGIDQVESGESETFSSLDALDSWMDEALNKVLVRRDDDAEPVDK